MHRFAVGFLFVCAGSFVAGCGSAPDSSVFSDNPSGTDSSVGGGDTGGVATDSGVSTDAPGFDSIVVPDVQEDHAPPPPPPGDTCATAIALTPTAAPQEATGDSSAAHDDDSTYSCGEAKGNDIFFTLAHPGGDLWVDTHGTAYATLLALRTACATASSEQACSDKTSAAPDSSRIVYRGLAAGTYTLVLDATTAGGGAYRLTYQAPGFPVQSTCDSPPMLISDLGEATKYPMGADIWDAIDDSTMASNVELRPGDSFGSSCKSAVGRDVIGQGPDQIWRLTLSEDRKLKVTPFPIDPGAFVTTTPGTFDVLSYLRAASGPPTGDPVSNCQDSSSSSDTCVGFGSEQSVPRGDWFLVFDSVGGSRGRYHMHVEVR